MKGRNRSVVVIALALGCGDRVKKAPAESVEHVSIGGARVARVAEVELPAAFVKKAVERRQVDPSVIVHEMIDDAVLAKVALSHGIDEMAAVRRDLTATRARAVVRQLRDASKAGGPPSDAEVKSLSEERWQEVDRPDGIRVIHAVVLLPSGSDSDKVKKTELAKQTAEDLLTRVQGATSADDFEKRAKSLEPPKGVDLRVEKLPPFVADGYVSEVGTQARMDETFTRAAFELKTPGEQSRIVLSPFGYHVIRLVEKVPGKVVPFEERRKLFADEIYLRRTRTAYENVLKAQGAKAVVEFAPNMDDLMKRAAIGE